ncbi:MAG: hypothetical protein AAFN10_22250, partial [Bacteroidota bacterium]
MKQGYIYLLVSALFWIASCKSDDLRPAEKIKLLGSYRQEKALDIKIAQNGNTYILGSTTVNLTQDEDLLLVALDPNGKELSSYVWGKQWQDNAGSLWVENNDVWVLSTESDTAIDTDMKLRRFDPVPARPTKSNEFPNRERRETSAAVKKDDADESLLCLGTSIWTLDGAARSAVYFYKVSKDGDMVWPEGRLYQQQGQQLRAIDFVILKNGNKSTSGYLILAETDADESGLGPNNLLLLKTDLNGNLQDTKLIGEANLTEEGVGILPLPGGEFLIATNVGPQESRIFRVSSSLVDISNTPPLASFIIASIEPLPDGDFLLGGTYVDNDNADDMA